MALEAKQVRLVLLGRDPYRTGATGVPAFKDDWIALNKRFAGYNILCSLLGKETLSDACAPRLLAFQLAEKGIVFLNCSYHYLSKERICRDKHGRYAELAYKENRVFLARAGRVILCGQACSMLSWVKRDLDKDRYKCAPHPALQARNRMKDRSRWDQYWQENALSSFLQ